jgi:glycosyltransferase involved in cell wall biosynthesis
MPPRVTVLMPIYNAAPHLLEAVNSVLAGRFGDLELLAINDGSTDGSEEILRSIADPRLRIVRNPENVGVAATLNRGLDLAEGDFIARMDSDDICMPDRLARQVAFMEANPEIGVCGTWARTFGVPPEIKIRPPLSSSEIHVRLFAFNAFCHPTVILRRSLFMQNELRYATDARHCEDLELWMRAVELFRVANLPLVGLRYRVHPNQVTKSFSVQQQETLVLLQRRQLLLMMSDATEAEIQLHLKGVDLGKQLTHDELVAMGEWLEHLEDSNNRLNRYDASAFRSFLVQRWLNMAHRCDPPNLGVWRIWRRSRFANVGMAAHLWLLCKKGLHR